MDKFKKWLAIAIVFQWLVANTFILILAALDMFTINEGVELLKSYNSVSSGIVGSVVGSFYFSKMD